MIAIWAIAWMFGIVVTSGLIHMTFGNAMLVGMFPEGRRWWMPWSRLASLAAFAFVVLAHPF